MKRRVINAEKKCIVVVNAESTRDTLMYRL